jgi:TP901 family phage tail tape measure protein
MRTFTIPTIFSAVDKFTGPINKMTNATDAFERKMRKVGTASLNVATKSAMVGAALVAPLAVAVNSAIKFEDKMADVAKTTGLQGEALDKFGDQILGVAKATRTSIDDIVKIAEIGGQLGVPASELAKFTEQSNKFAVALGADYGGTENAITQVGKINRLFKDTRQYDISESISRTGSAINELGAKGSGTSANINEFILRVGGLPDAIKPSFVATAALGTLFEESGIMADNAARGLGILVTTAGENMPKFAKQMNLSMKAANELYAADPAKFALAFGKSLQNIPAEKLPLLMQSLKLGSTEVQKVTGVLMTQKERYNTLLGVSASATKLNTSLQEEFNKKNNTTAAKLAIARNNMEILSITIGTMLLPVLNELIQIITPVIDRFVQFTKNNPGTVKAILNTVLALTALAFIVSGVSGGIYLYSQAAIIAAGASKVLGLAMNSMLGIIGLVAIAIFEVIQQYNILENIRNKGKADRAAIPLQQERAAVNELTKTYEKMYNMTPKQARDKAIQSESGTIQQAKAAYMEQYNATKDVAERAAIAEKYSALKKREEALNTIQSEAATAPAMSMTAEQQQQMQKMLTENNISGDINLNGFPQGTSAKSNTSGLNFNIGSTLTPSL